MQDLSESRPAGPRKLSRAARRVQLIEATIEVIAERGFARTTLSDVAGRAGLSHGLVNFHFESKDLLLSETLSYLSEEYRENWTRTLAEAGPRPAHQLDALFRADFSPHLFTPARLAAWVAFWGEAQSRPLYREKCGANDDDYADRREAICAALIAEGGYAGDAARISRALRLVTEGVWMDLVIMEQPYSRDEALATARCAAAAFFPRHFSPEGCLD
ncbi:TetR/AcrR family transcriptional regulator [Tabrizicola oligotrophica]|uniref:TetR/AcrR family transcriptional regulator n=1 Tax=Tabrizicola oligotrophica TaxID=2710650 RepID=A0A6M0QY41_9RHOB|nr:TetR/AcrR family transcriptional regulator [Tabrizicola oligotrophica]NEY91673.1 TetR/AcrR family transcriptional regulator [Tabrizicola oligotrophica]